MYYCNNKYFLPKIWLRFCRNYYCFTYNAAAQYKRMILQIALGPNTVWKYNLYRYALYNFSIATVVKIAMRKCRNGDGLLIKMASDLSVGWDDSTTSQRLNKLARCAPSGNWRRIGFIRVQTTTLTQKWTRKSDGIHITATQKYLIPLGMQKSLRRNYESQICKSWPVIPSNIKKSHIMFYTFHQYSINLCKN